MHPETEVPAEWRQYPCGEYFRDGWAQKGHFDASSQCKVVVTVNEIYERRDFGFLAVGRSGADGIDFGFRKDMEGLWAFYPIEQEFKLMAPDLKALVSGWCSGTLTV
jgi:hypothetical protein